MHVCGHGQQILQFMWKLKGLRTDRLPLMGEEPGGNPALLEAKTCDEETATRPGSRARGGSRGQAKRARPAHFASDKGGTGKRCGGLSTDGACSLRYPRGKTKLAAPDSKGSGVNYRHKM